MIDKREEYISCVERRASDRIDDAGKMHSNSMEDMTIYKDKERVTK